MSGILSDLPPTATLDDLRRRLELANVRYLAQHGATQADHERLVQRLGELVIEARREQWELSKKERKSQWMKSTNC